MSGGHFDYNQYVIDRIADDIEHLIEINGKPRKKQYEGDEDTHYEYPPDILSEFKNAVRILRTALPENGFG